MAAVAAAFSKAEGAFAMPVAIDADTIASRGSGAAARRAAGLAIAAVDAVLGPECTTRRAFVMARPPGHHAARQHPLEAQRSDRSTL